MRIIKSWFSDINDCHIVLHVPGNRRNAEAAADEIVKF